MYRSQAPSIPEMASHTEAELSGVRVGKQVPGISLPKAVTMDKFYGLRPIFPSTMQFAPNHF